MNNKKWFVPVSPYLAVWAGLFLFKSAWAALIGFHVSILLVLIIVRPNIPVSILFRSKSKKYIFINLLLCGVSGLGLYFLWNIFGVVSDLPAQLLSLGLNSSSWFIFIVYFSLVNPLIEEYFWRAYLGSSTKGFYIGDLIYAGYHGLVLMNKVHLVSILFALAGLTFIGWLWRQIYREDEGLLAPVLSHMAADFTILLSVYWMNTQ